MKRLCAGRNVVDLVNDFGAVVSHCTTITDAYRNALEYPKPLFVLKRLAIDFFGRTVASQCSHAYPYNCFLVDFGDFINRSQNPSHSHRAEARCE